MADLRTHREKRVYPAVDTADMESFRPDFAVVLYPGHMLEKTTKELELNSTILVIDKTLPTFLLQAVDDPVDNIDNSFVYLIALKKAGVPVELHFHAHGGHAFGLRHTTLPITSWPLMVET